MLSSLASDDRFIVKEVSQPEMRALMEFAPRYFEHMTRALINGVSL